MNRYICVVLACFTINSCAKYLDVSPDSSLDVQISNEDNIAEILTGAYPEASYFSFLEARTDNVAERIRGEHSQLNEAMYYWQDYDQEDLDTPLNYWNSCYSGIAQVNLALELLAKYPKTPRIKALYGEAFLLRAYLHFMLVNIWAEPYGTQKAASSPGIPYLTRPEKHALVSYDRGTVKQVYEQIEKDLKRGISLVDDSFYKRPKFHFNKKAGYAFASRFYLMTGQWEEVVKYSDYVLGLNPKMRLRRWTQLEKHRRELAPYYIDVESSSNLLLTTTESRIARELPKQKYGTTINQIIGLFNKRRIDGCASTTIDYKDIFPFVVSPASVPDGYYLPKFDELATTETGSSKPRGLYVTNVLLSTDEVMFNRIEAYAMLGDYDKAIDDLLDLLQVKYNVELPCDRDAYTWTSSNNYAVFTPFYGMTIKQLAIVKILAELRQREFLHEGLRWFDIRRFYLSIKRDSKHPLYHPLAKEDPRKTLQIPAEAIKQGLIPNPR